jgi:hypothetical protein
MEHPVIISARGKNYLKASFILNGNRQNIIAQYLSTQQGRSLLAQSMISPIRRHINYQSIAQKTFLIQPLPQGALPSYDRDIDVAACIINKFKHDIIKINDRGKPYNRPNVGQRIFEIRVMVPTFEIFANPTVRLSEVKSRRFDVIDRHVQKARQELMSQDDSMIFAALDKASEIESHSSGESKMDTNKVATGIKVFGGVLMVVCLALAIWSIFR